MKKRHICPCPNMDCPNHGNCIDCNSRHLKKGTLNYCGFYSILPSLEEAIKASPESETSIKIRDLINNQSQAYKRHMEKHSITQERQNELRQKKADFSEY